MRRLEVVYRPEAVADLEAIFLYVLDVSASFSVAAGFTDRIYDRCQRIGDAPRGGVARDDLGHGIRLVPFERREVILYRVEDDQVVIVNIFHGGRDCEALMRGGAT